MSKLLTKTIESELNENLGADNVGLLKGGLSMVSDNIDASGKLDKKGLLKSASSSALKFGMNKLVE
jgi:hypothetical protein